MDASLNFRHDEKTSPRSEKDGLESLRGESKGESTIKGAAPPPYNLRKRKIKNLSKKKESAERCFSPQQRMPSMTLLSSQNQRERKAPCCCGDKLLTTCLYRERCHQRAYRASLLLEVLLKSLLPPDRQGLPSGECDSRGSLNLSPHIHPWGYL